MSFLIGQAGSKARGDHTPFSGTPGVATKGNFMDPERPSALGVEDASRFRPQAVVAPRNVELMAGTFNLAGAADTPSHAKPPLKTPHGWYMSE
jgi:hypothetical protein